MTDTSWRILRAEMNVEDAADYVKHILNKHESEAKFVGGEQWQEFDPDSVGAGGIYRSCFWQYQFCRQQRAPRLARRESRPLLVVHGYEERWLPRSNWGRRCDRGEGQTLFSGVVMEARRGFEPIDLRDADGGADSGSSASDWPEEDE